MPGVAPAKGTARGAVTARRQMLALLGVAGVAPRSILGILADALASGLVQKAQAAASPSQPTEPRNHLYLELYGGPPRWYFDLPLNPYEPLSSLMRNQHVNTRFGGSGTSAGDLEYVSVPFTVAGKTINMPSLWLNSLPTSAGGSVPMSVLLENMTMIRGINMGSDGHDFNAMKHVRPTGAAPSLQGFAADISKTAIPVVALNDSFAYRAFRSGSGAGAYFIGGATGAIEALMSPFDQGSDGLQANYLSRRGAMGAVLDEAMKILAAQSDTRVPGSEAIYALRNKAEGLLKANIGQLSEEYSALVAKYDGLIARCLAQPILGVTDRPVPASQFSSRLRQIHAAEALNEDCRTYLAPGTSIANLAGAFAIAEVLFRGGMSRAVMASIPGPQLVNIEGHLPQFVWRFDEHDTGVVPSVIVNSFLFLSISACLNEFLGVMKADSLGEETVVQVAGEFSRSPRNDASGSDHGWTAACTSLFSGAFREPIVLGNCRRDGTVIRPASLGSWGTAGHVETKGIESQIVIGHATSTIARVLRVERPLPNNPSLLREENGRFVSNIEQAKTTDV